MSKPVIYFLVVAFVGMLAGSFVIVKQRSSVATVTQVCTKEVKLCADGTTVSRIAPSCEFELCKISVSTSTQAIVTNTSSSTSRSTSTSITTRNESTSVSTVPKAQQNTPIKNTPIISSQVSSLVNKVGSFFSPNFSVANLYQQEEKAITPSSYTNNASADLVYKPLPPKDFAGEKYIVVDNNIVTSDNKVIYNIPPEVLKDISSTSTGWTNTVINVVPVGTTPPIVGAVPVENLPGKFYLSENSFGDMSKCEFSNKIFILDTITNETILIFEENNTTLASDDPRACYSEIFLITTEKEKLILKYHTIGTNSTCDSAWSEPERTFFIDVTKLLTEGMKKYVIPESLSSGAEQEEQACRVQL